MKASLRTINKSIGALGVNVEMVKGRGYFYFTTVDLSGPVFNCHKIPSYYSNILPNEPVEYWIEYVKTSIKEWDEDHVE